MPKQKKDFARFQFSELKQNSTERLADYYARVHELAKKCSYDTHENDAIRDHLIRTMRNNNIRTRAIRQNWNLQQILTESALEEQTTEQAAAMQKTVEPERITPSIKKIDARKQRNIPWDKRKSDTCNRCGNS